MHNIYINDEFLYRKYSYMFRCICVIFRGLVAKFCNFRKQNIRLPEDDANASKHVGVLTT